MTGLVLAGGASRRMQGPDKAWLPLGERPMVAHVIDGLRPQVEELLVSANAGHEAFAALGARVVADSPPLGRGPLAGVERGLALAGSPWLAVVPCDAPWLAPDLVARLWQAVDAQRARCAVAWDGRRCHPTFALLSTDLLDDLRRWLASGERRLGAWLERHDPVRTDFSHVPGACANLNTPQDYERALRFSRGFE